ncbi:MAG TPA: RHS repeat-associated core domain-containing protein [Acidobacteriaceae bacterium]|jgi:RHS repeat-associated protein
MAGAVSYDTTHFSSPSFTFAISGLSGGSGGGTAASLIYQYAIEDSSGNSGYAANGNILRSTDSVAGPWSYTYDHLNRLTAAAVPAGVYQGLIMNWSFDNWGNQTAQTVPYVSTAGDHSATFGYDNRMASMVQAGSGITPGYDASGNLTSDGLNTMRYDAEGRLCGVYDVATSSYTQYIYNAAGERVAKGTISSSLWSAHGCDISANGFSATNRYVLDTQGGMVSEETYSGGTWTRQHTDFGVGPGVLASLVHSGGSDTWHYSFTDWLGTKRVQADASGTVESTWANLPYGDQLFQASGSSDATERHFTGKERDSETGLDYFGARYYGASVGRFTSPDWSAKSDPVPYARLGDPQTLNLYAYVMNNPVTRGDANGHAPTSPSLQAIGQGLGEYLVGDGEVQRQQQRGTPAPKPPPSPPAAPAQQEQLILVATQIDYNQEAQIFHITYRVRTSDGKKRPNSRWFVYEHQTEGGGGRVSWGPKDNVSPGHKGEVNDYENQFSDSLGGGGLNTVQHFTISKSNVYDPAKQVPINILFGGAAPVAQQSIVQGPANGPLSIDGKTKLSPGGPALLPGEF